MVQFKVGDKIKVQKDISATNGKTGRIAAPIRDSDSWHVIIPGYKGSSGAGCVPDGGGNRYLYESEMELLSSGFTSTRSALRKKALSAIKSEV